MDRGVVCGALSLGLACAQNRIEHRLTEPYHPWTNGQVEGMTRTLKEATVPRCHTSSHDAFLGHLALFLDAYNHAGRLKTRRDFTRFEFICRSWAAEPQRFTANPHQDMPGQRTSFAFRQGTGTGKRRAY